MGERKQYLLVMDVPGIKEYVFGTDRLVEIRGGSALLDYLNRKGALNFLKKRLGNTKVDCVFAGGGAGQFIIKASEEDLTKSVSELKGFFARKSKGGLHLICGMADFSDGNYTVALERAFLNLKKEKEEEGAIVSCSTPLHTGFIRECDSCSGMASQVNYYGQVPRLLCEVCLEKLRYGTKRKGLWEGFALFLQKQGIGEDESYALRPNDFEEIGERALSRKGYTALVYADGNAMGKLVKLIRSPDQFKFFSATVDSSIREACHEALFANCRQVKGKVPANILLLGGDDLLVYVTADTALPLTIDVAQRFNEKAKEKFAAYTKGPFFSDTLKGDRLTISLGIAYGGHHTPFSIMLNQAEELLKSAKKAGSHHSKDNRAEDYFSASYLDYHLSSHINQIKVSDCRQNHLTLQGAKKIKLYQKPYSLQDVQALLAYAKLLVEKKIPHTRLKRFGDAPSLGKVNGTLECLKLYARSRGEDQKKAVMEALGRFDCAFNIPWNQCSSEEDTTMLVDLIELTDFVAITTAQKEIVAITTDQSQKGEQNAAYYQD